MTKPHTTIPLTSMADYYARVAKDERYKLVAIHAYKDSQSRTVDYTTAIKWAEDYLDREKRGYENPGDATCTIMVNFYNRIMRGIEHLLSDKLISPNNINTFEKQ